MAINYKDTVALIEAVERMNPPASFLLDTFFPYSEHVRHGSDRGAVPERCTTPGPVCDSWNKRH